MYIDGEKQARVDQLKRVQRTFYYAAGSRADSSRAYNIITIIITRESIANTMAIMCTSYSARTVLITIIISSICRNASLYYIKLHICIRSRICFVLSIRRYLRFMDVTINIHIHTRNEHCIFRMY